MTTGTENTLCIPVLKSNAIINTMLHKKAKRLKLLSNLTLRKELSWDKFLWGINSNYAYNWVKINEKYDKLSVLQNRSWRRHHSQIVALWRHMVQRSGSTMVQVMAWRHQAITWTNVDWSSLTSSDIHMRAVSQEMLQASVTKLSLKIIYLKFYSNLPGANELK